MDVLYRTIEHKYGIELSDIDKKRIAYMFGVLDKEKYAKMNTVVAIDKISDVLYKGIIQMKAGREAGREADHTKHTPEFDMHELQKSQLGNATDALHDSITKQPARYTEQACMVPSIQTAKYVQNIDIVDFLGETNMKEMVDTPTVVSYLVLDSRYRNKNHDGLYWDYVPGMESGIGVVSTLRNIRNIRKIRMLKPMIPYVPVYMGPNNKRITVCINELKMQSYIIGTQYAHWIMSIDNSTILNGSPICDFDDEDWRNNEFIFNDKITDISHFTIKIGNTDTDIVFPSDTDTATITYGSPTILTMSSAHGFTGTTYITITGFNTDNPGVDSGIIAAINSKRDIVATVVNTTNLSIAINSTTVTPTVGLVVNVYYENRRVLVPLQITHEVE